jgi:hypothetical protein
LNLVCRLKIRRLETPDDRLEMMAYRLKNRRLETPGDRLATVACRLHLVWNHAKKIARRSRSVHHENRLDRLHLTPCRPEPKAFRRPAGRSHHRDQSEIRLERLSKRHPSRGGRLGNGMNQMKGGVASQQPIGQ